MDWDKLLEAFLSPGGLVAVVGIIGSALGLVAGSDAVRRRRIALAAYHAFHVVEDLAAETTTTADDKVAAGLKALDAYLLANGWRPAKPGEQDVARLEFQALNGEAKAEEKVRTNAAVAAAEASTATAPTPPVTP